MKAYYYLLRAIAVAATLATLAALLGLVAASAIPGLLILALGVSVAIQPPVLQPHQRPQRPAGPGWRWQQNSKRWIQMPGVEDEIDAAVAAWKTVYGEDIGYNEHAVTLEWLGSLHRTNDLTSDQLADCADSVEWITWSLKQPLPGSREGRKRADEPIILTPGFQVAARSAALCGCDACERERERERKARQRSGGSAFEITRQIAELETRSAATLRKVEAGTLSISEARTLIEGTDDMVGYLGAQRQAITGEPYPFKNAAYQAHVDRFTAMARRPRGYVIDTDKRVDAETFKKLRGEFRAKYENCDSSHTRERSLADTIPEAYNDWR